MPNPVYLSEACNDQAGAAYTIGGLGPHLVILDLSEEFVQEFSHGFFPLDAPFESANGATDAAVIDAAHQFAQGLQLEPAVKLQIGSTSKHSTIGGWRVQGVW